MVIKDQVNGQCVFRELPRKRRQRFRLEKRPLRLQIQQRDPAGLFNLDIRECSVASNRELDRDLARGPLVLVPVLLDEIDHLRQISGTAEIREVCRRRRTWGASARWPRESSKWNRRGAGFRTRIAGFDLRSGGGLS